MSDWVRSPSNLEKKFRLIYFISFVGTGMNQIETDFRVLTDKYSSIDLVEPSIYIK